VTYASSLRVYYETIERRTHQLIDVIQKEVSQYGSIDFNNVIGRWAYDVMVISAVSLQQDQDAHSYAQGRCSFRRLDRSGTLDYSN
jgi:hypothetical protein